MGEKKTFSIRADKDLIKSLRLVAVKREVSFGSLLEEAMKDLLKKYKEK